MEFAFGSGAVNVAGFHFRGRFDVIRRELVFFGKGEARIQAQQDKDPKKGFSH